MGSLLFWFVLAQIVEQNIILDEFQYDREQCAFFITVGFIYFLRLNRWSAKQASTKKLTKRLRSKVLIKQQPNNTKYLHGQLIST
jgi:hypothetical protein